MNALKNINTYNAPPKFKGITRLEKSLMEEVSAYSAKTEVETVRTIKAGKDISKYFDVWEDKDVCLIMGGDLMPSKVLGFDMGFIGKTLNSRQMLKDSIYIHSHTSELPLSPADISAAIKMKIKKMIAVTPLQNYSSVEFDPRSRKIAKKNFGSFNDSIQQMVANIKKQGGDDWLTNKELCSTYTQFAVEKLAEFAKKCGFDFEVMFKQIK